MLHPQLMLPAGQRVEYKYVILEEQVSVWACLERGRNAALVGWIESHQGYPSRCGGLIAVPNPASVLRSD